MASDQRPHRSELDGLRAISLIGVLGLHAPFRGFSGGYVGVDVFFTLSGYLIARIVMTDFANGEFSFRQFYMRRIRRIIPALIPMMIAVLLVGAWVLTPQLYANSARTILAMLVLAPNFTMPSRASYFSSESHLNPVLHIWTLGIEEQFYLFFPLFMLLAWRSHHLTPLMVMSLVVFASLGFALLTPDGFSGDHFYMPWTRAWELALGAMAAQLHRGPLAQPPALGIRQTLSAFGLAAIILPMHFYTEAQSLPGFYNMAPVIGTLLIALYGDQETWVGRLLAIKPLVWLGLISYSVYIWHQPIYAFMQLTSVTPVTRGLRIFATLIILFVGWASWRWIEGPFRDRKRTSGNQVLISIACAWLLIAGAAAAVMASNGWASRKLSGGGTAEAILAAEKMIVGFDAVCSGFTLDARCRSRADPQILVWGDSHAMDSVLGVDAASADKGVVQMTMPACPPSPGFARADGPGTALVPDRAACLRFQQQVMDWLPQQTNIRVVIMATAMLPQQFYSADGPVRLEHDETAQAVTSMIAAAERIRAMGKIPIFIAPLPSAPVGMPRCALRNSLLGLSLDQCSFSLAEWRANASVQAAISRLARHMTVIQPSEILCERGQCQPVRDGIFLYSDHRHLTDQGSIWLARRQEWRAIIDRAR